MGPRIMFLKIKGSFIYCLPLLCVAHLGSKRRKKKNVFHHYVLWLQRLPIFSHQYSMGLLCHWGNGNHCVCHVLPRHLNLLLDPLPQHPPEPGPSWPTARSSSGRSPDPLPETRVLCGREEPAGKPVSSKPISSPYPDATRWMRTPSGWTSVPEAYAPDDRQFPQLPFPEFPPILYLDGHYNHPFSQMYVCMSATEKETKSSLTQLFSLTTDLFTILNSRNLLIDSSSSWTLPQGRVEPPPPVVWSGSPNPLCPLSVTGYRGHSPARPLVSPLLGPGGTPCWRRRVRGSPR